VSAEDHLIAGRYRLHQRIGSGAMGVVWRAIDERLHRTVAVKQLLLQPGYTDEETEEARQRSMREGRIAARLQHQNAIVVFDVAEDEGQPVLVMEYLPSQSLASVLAEQGPLAPQAVARIGAQVSGALAAAHQAGIVHRDLKPGNILLGENGVAKITDFGISRAIGDVSVTKSGILAGTPAYLSPEVALGRDPAPASDVFSLGSTLYAAIEGEPPFGVDENAISLLHRVARGQVEPPRQAGPMTAALMQLLRPDPVDRPTMAQARTMLQAVVDGRPIPGSAPASARQPTPTVAAAAHPPGQDSSATRVGAPAASHPSTQVDAIPAEQTGPARSGRTKLLWVVAVLVAILVGVLVANAYGTKQPSGQGKPSAQSTKAEPPPPVPATAAPQTASSQATTSATNTSTSSAARRQPSAQEVEQTVRTYYTLVPRNLDQAWSMLGPSLQAQGKERYERFWKSIDDVRIVNGPTQAGQDVYVILMFVKDGRVSQEMHKLGMVANADGTPLINTDSRT
jgi:eukaryotic-like serine/threonine-protein kinase